MIYRGVGDGINGQLWTRRWDALLATPLEGTEGAWEQAISPDGSEIAFAVVGSEAVYVMSLDGGQRRAIIGADMCCPRWSSDGEWIYVSKVIGADGIRGVRRVPATGGEIEEITSMSASDGHQGIIDVLPDDRGLLIHEQSAATGEDRIMALDLDSREMTFLALGTHPRYSPTGHILFVDPQRRLVAAPFDLRTLALKGPGVALAENLARLNNGTAFYSISPTGRIVYLTQPPAAGLGRLRPIRVGRDGSAVPIDPEWTLRGNATFSSLELSPDGQRLAVSVRDVDGRWDLWVKSLDQGPLSRATFTGATNFRATWSPDGQRLTFPRPGQGVNLGVWTVRADGAGDPELVLERDLTITEAFFSPDGDWLVFREGDTRAGNGDILGCGLPTEPWSLSWRPTSWTTARH